MSILGAQVGKRRLTMNGKTGNAKDRPLNRDQPRIKLTVRSFDDDTTGQGEVAIEPGVPDSTAIRLHPDLQVS
jgi:hypothetical protein